MNEWSLLPDLFCSCITNP